MKEKNIYGFYSGGFLFDMMDRIAQDNAILELPQFSYHYTYKVKVTYMKQACKKPTDAYIKVKPYIFCKNKVKIIVTLSYEGIKYCSAEFIFVGKNKNYCEYLLTKKK